MQARLSKSRVAEDLGVEEEMDESSSFEGGQKKRKRKGEEEKREPSAGFDRLGTVLVT